MVLADLLRFWKALPNTMAVMITDSPMMMEERLFFMFIFNCSGKSMT
jgi:hypothetical protein